ncbi:leucine-rich repeat domain-containing protein [Aquimarina sp. SS2-1]|uniref:leucine-rich repeat domain-containing protein n=1 Tax=Aquimarina besae TaxID=3342247 RepID=UPI00366F38BA
MKKIYLKAALLITILLVSCTKEISDDLVINIIVDDFENVSEVLLKILEDNPDNTLNWDGDTNNLSNWEGIVIENNKLTQLNLENKGITILTPTINKLQDLRVLNLKENLIVNIPIQIFDLQNLKELSLSGQNIGDTMDDVSGLYSLSNLEKLGLEHFDIYHIEGIESLTKLKELTLKDLAIRSLPGSIVNLKELKTFTLKDNKDLTALPVGFEAFENLESLTISGSPGIQFIESRIFDAVSLQKLDLSNNNIGIATNEEGILPDDIEKLTQLTDLNLENNYINTISTRLGDLTSLKILNLRNNRIIDIPKELGMLTILDILDISGNLQLNEIPVEVCKLQDTGTTIIIDGMCEELRVSSRYVNNPSMVTVGFPFIIDIDIDADIDPVFIDGDGPFDLDFGEIGFEVHEVHRSQVTIREDVPGQVLVTRSETQQFINGFRNMTFELFAPFVVSTDLPEGRTYRVRLFNTEIGNVKTYLPAYELIVLD